MNTLHENALRFAAEWTKMYLMEEYRRRYPHLFGDARLDYRPATDSDYFIPPSIADQCIVVTGTQFSETACQRLSCYPFKEGWEPCQDTDNPRWIRMGQHFELACSCEEQDSINTEWFEGKCYEANPFKKILASMPEKLFEKSSHHVFHGGLDVVGGTLKFNSRYCEAYGLDHVNEDCIATGGQKFGEWLLGTTFIRGIKAATLKPLTSQPPPLPVPVKRRNKRSLPIQSQSSEEGERLLQELAMDLAKDFTVSEGIAKKFLRRKISKFINLDKLSTKLALKFSFAKSFPKIGIGKVFLKATIVYALYDIAMSILDIIDPYELQNVLDKKTLEKIDKELDILYFEDETIRPEVTPEYIWENGILEEDETEKLEYMAKKIEEYLNAVEAIPPREKPVIKSINLFQWKKETSRDGILLQILALVLICFMLVLHRWIHLWTSIAFFGMVCYQAS